MLHARTCVQRTCGSRNISSLRMAIRVAPRKMGLRWWCTKTTMPTQHTFFRIWRLAWRISIHMQTLARWLESTGHIVLSTWWTLSTNFGSPTRRAIKTHRHEPQPFTQFVAIGMCGCGWIVGTARQTKSMRRSPKHQKKGLAIKPFSRKSDRQPRLWWPARREIKTHRYEHAKPVTQICRYCQEEEDAKISKVQNCQGTAIFFNLLCGSIWCLVLHGLAYSKFAEVSTPMLLAVRWRWIRRMNGRSHWQLHKALYGSFPMIMAFNIFWILT